MFGTVGERMVSEKKKDVAKPWILFALIGLLILFRFLLAAGLEIRLTQKQVMMMAGLSIPAICIHTLRQTAHGQ